MENETKTFEEIMKEEIENGYIDEKGYPLKCKKCGSEKPYKQVVKDVSGGCVCEYEAICPDCGSQMGYWAYGYWQV